MRPVRSRTKIFCLLLLLGLIYAPSHWVQPVLAQDEFPLPAAAANPADPETLVDTSSDIQPELVEVSEATATFTVNTTADLPDLAPGNGVCKASNGACSLRAAIGESNFLPGVQTVYVPDNIYYVSTELKVISDITISGQSRFGTIIDGKAVTRVIKFFSNSTPSFLSNMTIRNGNNQFQTEPAGDGGGIFNEGTLTLTNVHVTGCRGYSGGGVYNQYWFGTNVPQLYLNHVEISFNASNSAGGQTGGGGLFNGSKLVGEDVNIHHNTASQAGGGFFSNSYSPTIRLRNFYIHDNIATYGGGVENDLTRFQLGYSLVLEDGIIRNNTARCCGVTGSSTGGGGIYNNQAIMNLTNVAITDNKVPSQSSPTGYGGGIVNIQWMNLRNVSITGNQATYGAGIFNGNYNSEANKLVLTNVTLSGNQGVDSPTAMTEGGAIFNVGWGKMYLVNSTVVKNYAELAGGIENRHTTSYVEIVNSILADNTDLDRSPDCYGAVNSLGNNLVGDGVGSNHYRCTLVSRPTDQMGISSQVIDLSASAPLPNFPISPFLRYHPLLPTSTAINHGSNLSCPQVDIIETPRPINAICDIGAVEFDGVQNVSVKIYLPLLNQ